MLDHKITTYFIIGLCFLISLFGIKRSACYESKENHKNIVNNILYAKTDIFLRNMDNVILTCSDDHRIIITMAFLSYLTDIKSISNLCKKNIVQEVRTACFAYGVHINSCKVSTLLLSKLSDEFRCNTTNKDENIIISFQCYQAGFVSICSKSEVLSPNGPGFLEPQGYGNLISNGCSENLAGKYSCPLKQCESRWSLPSNANRATLEIILLDLHLYTTTNPEGWGDFQFLNESKSCDPSENDVLALQQRLPDTKGWKSIIEWCTKELEFVALEKRSVRLNGVAQVLNSKLVFSRDYLSLDTRRGFLLQYKVKWCTELIAPHNTFINFTSELLAELHCLPGTTLSSLQIFNSNALLQSTINHVQLIVCQGVEEGWRPAPRPCVSLKTITMSTSSMTPLSIVSSSYETTATLISNLTSSVASSLVIEEPGVKPLRTETKHIVGLVGGVFSIVAALTVLGAAAFLWRRSKKKKLKNRIAFFQRLSTAGLSGPLIMHNDAPIHRGSARVQMNALPPVPYSSSAHDWFRGSTAPLLQSSCDGSWNDSLTLRNSSGLRAAPLANLRELDDLDSSPQKIGISAAGGSIASNCGGGLIVRLPSFRSRYNSYGDELAEADINKHHLRRAPSAETYLEPSMLPCLNAAMPLGIKRFHSIPTIAYYDSATCVCPTDVNTRTHTLDTNSHVSTSDPDILDIYEIYEDM